MRFPDKYPTLNTIMIILFFWMWLYTEIEEQQARARDEQAAIEWKAFIRTGARFTAEDGAELKARIKHLEEHANDVHQ